MEVFNTKYKTPDVHDILENVKVKPDISIKHEGV